MSGPNGIAALVVAAGGSSRLGTPKQLLDWGGRPLLEHVLAGVATWPVDPVYVVLGASAEAILDEVDVGGASVVINPEWEEGMASSLRVGLDALERETRVEAAVLALGDQPSIAPAVVAGLVAEFLAHRPMAVVPRYRYTRSNPALVARSLWGRLMSLTGDAGARRLLEAHPEWVREVYFDLPPPRDVDTAADVADLRPRP